MTTLTIDRSVVAPRTAWSGPVLPAAALPATVLPAAGIRVGPVRRATPSTPAALRQAVADRSGPAVFPGLGDGWPARWAWTPDELRRRHGDQQVTALMDLPGDGVLFPHDQADYERALSFRAFVDAMLEAGPSAPCYLAYQRAADMFDPADHDVASLPPADGSGTDTRVWIGSAGTRSMLHSDLKDNLFCQVWGEKSVTLLPWRDSRAAYPLRDNLVNSQVDLARPDSGRFPRLRGATFQHVTMRPGDVLLIPRGCWHDIRARTPSVSINHWFGPPQSTREYLRLLAALGPAYWTRAAHDFVVHGVAGRPERTTFFFSPPSTGRRLYDAARGRDFSGQNDPNQSD